MADFIDFLKIQFFFLQLYGIHPTADIHADDIRTYLI